jgi:predicted ester cyclase
MSRDDNQAVLRAHLVAENRHDLDATLATVHPDCVFIDEQLGKRWAGIAGAAEHYRTWWEGFGATLDSGDLHWVSDDLVIGDAVFAGRHVGPFAGIAPTGHQIRLPFVVFVTFKDALVAGERFVYDMAGLLAQLR